MVEADPPSEKFLVTSVGVIFNQWGVKSPDKSNAGRGAERVGHWDWCPSPQPNKRPGERREFPQWGLGRVPAANAFLTYLKPTEQSIKSSIFRKRPLNWSIRGHGHWTISSWAGGGHSSLAGGTAPLALPLATGLIPHQC